MKRLKNIYIVLAGLLMSASVGTASDSTAFKLIVQPSAYGWVEFGQIVHGDKDKRTGQNMNHVWMQRLYSGLVLDADISPKLDFKTGLEIKMFNEFPRAATPGGTRRLYFYPYLTSMRLHYNGINTDTYGFQLDAGYFPYKYNPDVRNLGEYLFRSTTYPQTVYTEFDYNFARILGLRLHGRLGKDINLDIIASSNLEWMAVHDLNLSAIGSYNAAGIFEVGFGASFCSIISVDNNATTPKNPATQYTNDNGDTLNYTFAGTKAMVRASFDPKPLFSSDLFGKEDLKLYAEANVLGWKDYPEALSSPIWYSRWSERIPVVLGFNFPAFKLLNVLSIEGEYWKNRYPNSIDGIVNEGLPLPFASGLDKIDSTKYINDNYKWSVYGKRTFGKYFTLAFQVANDHMRTYTLEWPQQDWEEALRSPKHWYYVVKCGIGF